MQERPHPGASWRVYTSVHVSESRTATSVARSSGCCRKACRELSAAGPC